jgi:monoamine oxidase
MQPTDTREYREIIQNGFAPTRRPQKVVIVGAGMAGLSAAYELQRAGHEPLVLEAQPRVGGRVYTLREPFSDGLYAEAGAMRIPRIHDLTMAYIEKFKLKYSSFTMGNANSYYFINGQRMRVSEANANPDSLGFAVAPHERGKSYAQMWDEAIRPIVKKLETGGSNAWDEIVAEYDEFSIREFLESRQWSEGAIEMYGLLADQEAIMNTSFLELLREEVGNYYTNMIELDGGMDHLPRAFLPALRGRIRFGAKMIAMDQSPESVTIHYETAAGRMTATGDYAIITAPFPVLRHIEVLKPFSRVKRRAIRQAHYDASAKILFQCRRRFWEEDDGIFGGGTITDLPVRVMYYPDHHRDTGRGIILASYTWGEDAERWASLSPRDRIEQALEDVAQIHPQITQEFEVGVSHVWHNAEFAAGAFALFDPGQQTLLYNAMIAPEGRIHFAGEHASLAHAWIQGAIESGLRAAREIHQKF